MKVYLAGPEVFLPNARTILDEKIEMARKYGFVPVSPGDLQVPASLTGRSRGLAISAVNEQLMMSADMIIANLTPFRGISADVGTVYELGFMCARGLPAYAFTNVAQDYFERVKDYYRGDLRQDGQHGAYRGPDGLLLENYGLVDNLMLDGGIESRKGTIIRHVVRPDDLYTDLTAFEKCLATAAEQLLSNHKSQGARSS
jgi:nucleoside 2-deoxyribosyltransferase